jgi:hypothetical protein
MQMNVWQPIGCLFLWIDMLKLPLFKALDLLCILATITLAVLFIIRPNGDGEMKHLVLLHGDNSTELAWEKQSLNLYELTGKNISIEVETQRARVLHSDCPDKVCVKTGWVSACGELAACLPNRVALYIDCGVSE